MAFAAITSERKATSISANASRRTNPKTSGAADFSLSLKSFVDAVIPVTPTSAPGSAPTVVGTSSSLSVASAASESASIPLPSTGMAMVAMVPASLTSTVIGSCICPLESALHSSWPIASCTCGAVTSSTLTTTPAGISLPGKAA